MARNRIVLVSPLSPAGCAARINVAIAGPTEILSDRPIQGWATDAKLIIWKNTWRRSGAQRALIASISPLEKGALIRGHFGLRPIGKWILGIFSVWMSGIAVVALGVAFANGGWREGLIGVVGLGAIAGFVLPIVLGGHLFANELPALLEFLRTSINAREQKEHN